MLVGVVDETMRSSVKDISVAVFRMRRMAHESGASSEDANSRTPSQWSYSGFVQGAPATWHVAWLQNALVGESSSSSSKKGNDYERASLPSTTACIVSTLRRVSKQKKKLFRAWRSMGAISYLTFP